MKNKIINGYGEMIAKEAKTISAINHCIENRNSGNKSKSAYQNCFCRHPNFTGSYEEFKKRIEGKFNDGMNWNNYPEW
jgi:hypothetical protein